MLFRSEVECSFRDGKLINNSTSKHIKALIVVHVFGNMANMECIIDVSKKYNLKVIEDATEALGTHYINGRYNRRHAGTIGDVGVYSFNGNKIMTTGGGGMIVSNDYNLLKRAKHLTTQAKSDELYFIHDEIGYNYRMTNIQAALGIAQLEQLETFIKVKKNNYEHYKSKIKLIQGLRVLEFSEFTRPNYWFYALYIDPKYALNRDELIKYMASMKIQLRPIWGLISDQKPYEGSQTYRVDKSKLYLENVVNIPCSSNLSYEDVEYVLDCLKQPKVV
mgnify:FL=1